MLEDDLGKELAQAKPETKIGKLRKHMPLIEQKLAEGISAKTLVGILAKHGIEIDLRTFRNYVHLYRKQKKTIGSGPSVASIKNSTPENKVDEKKSMDAERPKQREPLSVQELQKVMNPDPIEFEKQVDESVRRYKEHLKNEQRKK